MIKFFGVFFIFIGIALPSFCQNNLHIQIPEVTVELEDSSFFLPVNIDNLAGDSISGFKLKLSYDPDVISIESFSKSATLSSGFSIFGNNDSDETFIISGAGSTPIKEDGVLINLQVLINNAGSSPVEIIEIEINEGEPAFDYSNGSITVVAPVAIPEAPELLLPANNQEHVSLSPKIEWKSVSEADTYQIQLSFSENFISLIVDETVSDTSLTIESLEYKSNYYWRVRAINESGAGDWSEVYFFTTIVEAPEKPELSSPSNNTAELDTLINFQWSDALRADSFIVQISETDHFGTIVRELITEANFLSLGGLNFSTTYFWRVKAINTGGESDWSEVFNFTTKEKDNKGPYVQNHIGYIALNEDFSELIVADLDTVFADDDSESFVYDIVENTAIIEAKLDQNKLILISKKNKNGEDEIVINATDENGEKVSDTLDVIIQPVNDIPHFLELPDSIIFKSGEDFTFEFAEIAMDVEDEVHDLAFSFNIEPSEIEFNVSITDSIVTISASDFAGEGTLTVKVTDSDGGEIEETIVIIIEKVTSIGEDKQIPVEFTLSQNYPNPFNPSTQIKYQLPKAEEVSLKIFDLTGRVIFSQRNNLQPAGTYTITIDAANLSSGIYIYQVKAGDFVEIKKMTLIK